MRIDLHNYEAFFLDYREGNLDEAQVRELFAFLDEYPQLRNELDSYEEWVLEDEIFYETKAALKKTEFSDESLIAYTEGLLADEQRCELEKLAGENAALKKELDLYKRTIVVADAAVRFPNKRKLKRGGVIIYLQSNPVYLRVAAAVLLLAGLFFLVSQLSFKGRPGKALPALASDRQKKNSTPVVRPQQGAAEKHALASNSKNVIESGPVAKKNMGQSPHINKPVEAEQHQSLLPANEPLLADNKKVDSSATENKAVTDAGLAANAATHKSYVNYRNGEDEEEEQTTLVASAAPAKKTFFDKLTRVARQAHALGVKSVNAGEEEDKKSIRIGGLVVSESYTN